MEEPKKKEAEIPLVVNNQKKGNWFPYYSDHKYLYWGTAILIVMGILAIFVLPYFFVTKDWSGVDFNGNTSHISDTVNGIAGPFIALGAAFLTFIAFYIQFRANRRQDGEIQGQKFEDKFFKMLDLHRDNAMNIKIGTRSGNKVFISMFNELKFIYFLTQYFYRENHANNSSNKAISPEVLYNISYLIFFFGVGPNSSPIIIDIIGKQYEGFFVNLAHYIEISEAGEWKNARANSKGKGEKISTYTPDNLIFSFSNLYKPCDGHLSRFSHYIRLLFQFVKFIDDEDSSVLSDKEKYSYISIIRTKLSPHEQLLIYYNAVSILGKPWLDKQYLKKYCLLRSMPLPNTKGFYEGISPEKVLGKQNIDGIEMFEWAEIKERFTRLV